MNNEEQWHPLIYKLQNGEVIDLTGRFAISNLGNVWSYHKNDYKILRKRRNGPANAGRVNGYLEISYSYYRDGKNKSKCLRVHRAVASAFCDGYEPGLEVNHKDGHLYNNRADNLEWICPEAHKELKRDRI